MVNDIGKITSYASQSYTGLPALQTTAGRFEQVGQVLLEYYLSGTPADVYPAVHFSVDTFNSSQNNNGTLRKVNIYMGIETHFELGMQNQTPNPVHETFGTRYAGNRQIVGPTFTGMNIYYGDSGAADQLCSKYHNWPDEQDDLAAYTGNPGVFTGPDAHIYLFNCNEIPQLVTSVEDPAYLARWSDIVGTIQMSYQQVKIVHLWPFPTISTFLYQNISNNAYFDIEYLYSY